MNNKKWQGYVFSREINGNIIPQRVQNLVVRTYVTNSGNDFILSATEFNLEGSFMALWAVVEDFNVIDGVVFYSLHMLPKNSLERKKLYQLAFQHNVEIHFALEDMFIKSEKDIAIIEDILLTNEIAPKGQFFKNVQRGEN